MIFYVTGVATFDSIPRLADPNDGRQGAFPPRGEMLCRQGQQFEQTKRKVGRKVN